ncbi:hypothetical protein AB0I84_21590 [Streptomyces spectabilis]|uniref:hypothetical protein n=1 Tax=Streptomyces spectabilis TaxID=68270 RepID=UPI003401CDB9
MLITDAAVQDAATALAQLLGGDWTLNPTAPNDGAAHLIYSDGRAISFRPVFGGAAVQLWITGNAEPPAPTSASSAERANHEARITARLPEGQRYNKATSLLAEDDEDPAAIILRTLEDHLLPAFEYKPRYVGHRPWIDLFDNALAAVAAERPAPPASPEPELNPEATPKAEGEAQPEAATGDQDPDEAPADTGERDVPQHETHTATGPTHEPTTADKVGAQTSEEPKATATRRPRKRAPKRRPKANST